MSQRRSRPGLPDRRPHGSVARFVAALVVVGAFYMLCLYFAEIDLKRLWDGLPRLGRWAAVDALTSGGLTAHTARLHLQTG